MEGPGYGHLPKNIPMDDKIKWLHKEGVGVFLRRHSNANTSMNQISLLKSRHICYTQTSLVNDFSVKAIKWENSCMNKLRCCHLII